MTLLGEPWCKRCFITAGCWQVYFGSQHRACGKSAGCFAELQLTEIHPYLLYISSFCSSTQTTYMTKYVKSLCLTGKCYPLLPHSSRQAYNQTGLTPQGFKVFKAKKSNRKKNSLSIAWEIWLDSHAWLPELLRMEETLILSPVTKSCDWRAVTKGPNTAFLGQ